MKEETNKIILDFQEKHGYEPRFVGSEAIGNRYLGFKSKKTGEWEYWNYDLTERKYF